MKKHYEYNWGELNLKWCGPCVKLSAWSGDHDTLNISFLFFNVFIKLPYIIKRNPDKCSIEQPSYGFTYFEKSIHFHWGQRFYLWHLPWDWNFYKRWEQVQFNNIETQKPEYKWIEISKHGPDYGTTGTKYHYYYTYVRHNGEKQIVLATYYVDKMVWRWNWLMFLPWPRKVHISIDVDFDNELGERTGSWKGGVRGTSFQMFQNEHPEDTIRRMEKERKFN